MPLCSQFKNFVDERNFYKSLNYEDTLITAVKKRLLSDRPIACLLSGGLDSSLITSIVVNLLKDKTKNKLETFSIGLPGSTDLIYAKKGSKLSRYKTYRSFINRR